jgi:phosphoglycerate dehydrogenase-like enzyme
MKAVLQYRATPAFRNQIAELEAEWLRIVIVDDADKPTFAREMQDADVLLHVLEPVKAVTIDAAPNLKLIQKLGIGVDTIDLEAARRSGIAVCNMPGTNTRAVAELTLLLMLATLRRLAELHAQTREGNGWSLDSHSLDNLCELGGRTVGLVGFGAVGRCLTPMLHGIGAKVIYTTRAARDVEGPLASGVGADGDPRLSAAEYASFQDLLSTADVVSLHLPLMPHTAGLMNAAEFASMKRGAILINTARGGLVDEAALLAALTSRQLRGAGLDVFGSEPVDVQNPLLKLPNVIVTPHLAWFTTETLARSLRVFQDNCRRLLDGRPLVNRVV